MIVDGVTRAQKASGRSDVPPRRCPACHLSDARHGSFTDTPGGRARLPSPLGFGAAPRCAARVGRAGLGVRRDRARPRDQVSRSFRPQPLDGNAGFGGNFRKPFGTAALVRFASVWPQQRRARAERRR